MTSDSKSIGEVDALIAAWRELYPHEETGRRGDASARAQLRRAATPAAVELEPAFHDLLRRMKQKRFDFARLGKNPSRYRRLALVAGLLAGLRNGSSGTKSLMKLLGGNGDPAENTLKPLRFQALIGALDRGDDTEIMTALRRALMMAKDDAINIKAFAGDILFWNEDTHRRWTYDYFGHPYNPDSSAPQENASEEISA